ncbi:MAG TPA: TetR/AcrR family transcriptional regulator [Anaerolineales bacterium]|nr:TetR/AcrR family transcriptional regulator [Anaerolineales bacterium]
MHDAEGAREAILNAGEEVFAEHGFDGARIDAIAKVSGYNKSLIFQYFGDKLGLYAAVIRRSDEQMRGWQEEALTRLRADSAVDFNQIKELLCKYVSLYFDYLVEHPRILRIYNWELAEGWQTFSKVLSERDFQDIDDFAPVFSKFQAAGLMRLDPDPLLQYTTALFTVSTYLAILPFYQIFLPKTDLDSPAMLAQGRDFLIEFITNGLLVAGGAKKQPPLKKTTFSRQPKGK